MKIAQTRKLHAAGILPKPLATQDVGQLRERLEALRLMFAAATLDDMLSQSVREDWNASPQIDWIVAGCIIAFGTGAARRAARGSSDSHFALADRSNDLEF